MADVLVRKTLSGPGKGILSASNVDRCNLEPPQLVGIPQMREPCGDSGQSKPRLYHITILVLVSLAMCALPLEEFGMRTVRCNRWSRSVSICRPLASTSTHYQPSLTWIMCVVDQDFQPVCEPQGTWCASKCYLSFKMIYRSHRDVPSCLDDNESTPAFQRRDLACFPHFASRCDGLDEVSRNK